MNYDLTLHEAGLYDICEWFIERYPDDIFDGSSKDQGIILTIGIKNLCKQVLIMRDKKFNSYISR